MLSYEQIRERSINHYRSRHIENRRIGIPDPACVICHPPPERIMEEFERFWDWYKAETPAISYSEYTTKIFEELRNIEGITEQSLHRDTKLIYLIGSVKYSEEPEETVTGIALRVLEIFIC